MSDEYEMTDDSGSQSELPPNSVGGAGETQESPEPQTGADKALVQRILSRIKRDKQHHKKAFDRMRDSMFLSLHGRDKDWGDENYTANIVGRHIEQKTAALYAKNPKIVARRKDSIDFRVWDETVASLQMAMQVVQAGAALQAQFLAAQQAPPDQSGVFAPAEAALGHNGGPPLEPPMPPPMPAGYEEALAIVEDFKQGMERRQMLKKFGKTLELVFADAMRRQTPLDFKSAMKGTVCRSLTTAVGYVEMGFQDVYGIPSATTERLADHRRRIAHLEALMQKATPEKAEECKAEAAELRAAIAALENEPQVIIRSGLTFDFIQSTKVIPDRLCTSIIGFVGARHLTIEYLYTKAEVEEMFKVKLGQNYTPYTVGGERAADGKGVDYGSDGVFGASGSDDDLVCLYKHYDKTSGLVYHLVDGHHNHIKPPQAPDVTVPRFWPVYALTFNRVESEDQCFPKSDAERLKPVQKEVNRSRQGKREHRDAARPRWAYPNGALDEEEDIPRLKNVKAFDAIALNGLGVDVSIGDVLQPIPISGVDPNLYDTNEVLQDAALTVGAQGAQLGGLTKSTATGVAVANESVSSIDGSATDDLDSCLTAMARDGGQILMTRLDKEAVAKIAGVGAVWIEDLGMEPEDVYDEVFLEVEAGSTGKPNQAQEVRNFKELGPLLLQIGSIAPEWLARHAVRTLDDRIDLTEAVVSGLPAIVAQNRMAQPAQGDPSKDPNQQGEEGGDKNATPPAATGSDPGMGNNQSPGV